MSTAKILYFDVDGVLLSYDDEPKSALVNGELEMRLKALCVDKLVCVSGWSDIVNAEVNNNSYSVQKLIIWGMLEKIFHDKNWFLEHLDLVYDTDNRCKHIKLEQNWIYMDDWADKFFSKKNKDEETYEKYNGNRILLVDPFCDGADIIEWLDNKVNNLWKKNNE